MALVLSGLVVSFGPFLSTHLLQDNDTAVFRSASPVEACQPGNGHGLVPDHTLLVEPVHVCVICKSFQGTLDAGAGLAMPLFSPSFRTAFSQGLRLHFAGFSRVSRSPPSRS